MDLVQLDSQDHRLEQWSAKTLILVCKHLQKQLMACICELHCSMLTMLCAPLQLHSIPAGMGEGYCQDRVWAGRFRAECHHWTGQQGAAAWRGHLPAPWPCRPAQKSQRSTCQYSGQAARDHCQVKDCAAIHHCLQIVIMHGTISLPLDLLVFPRNLNALPANILRKAARDHRQVPFMLLHTSGLLSCTEAPVMPPDKTSFLVCYCTLMLL